MKGIKGLLSHQEPEKRVNAFFFKRPDYYYGVFTGPSKKTDRCSSARMQFFFLNVMWYFNAFQCLFKALLNCLVSDGAL